MVKPFPSKTHVGNHMLHPETLMLNYGYDPVLSEGAVKPPVLLTSTFVSRTAEDGQNFFRLGSARALERPQIRCLDPSKPPPTNSLKITCAEIRRIRLLIGTSYKGVQLTDR
jgi:hypothetical protein